MSALIFSDRFTPQCFGECSTPNECILEDIIDA